MKICFISHSSSTGGAEKVLLETIEIFQGLGVECVALLPEKGELCTELDRLKVPFRVLPFPHWMARGEVSILRKVRMGIGTVVKVPWIIWKISPWKCDLIYTNTATLCIGGLIAFCVRRPHIWHLHEFGREDQGLSFLFGKTFSLTLVDKLSSTCICVSHALAKMYRQYIRHSKIAVIYPSMHRALHREKSQFRDIEVSVVVKPFRMVIVGALMEGKGQEDGVLALAHLKHSGVDAELLIVGDGIHSYHQRLTEIVRENDLESQVKFIGRVPTPLSLVDSSDVVLVCSRSEAFGRVTIEAMLAGKPLVGANSAATSELISDEVTGLLYEPGNPKDLAIKIARLYNDPVFARSLGARAKSWATSAFTMERYRQDMAAVLAPYCEAGSFNLESVPSI